MLNDYWSKPYPKHCCQKCGYNVGYLGRYVFGSLYHDCIIDDKSNLMEKSMSKGIKRIEEINLEVKRPATISFWKKNINEGIMIGVQSKCVAAIGKPISVKFTKDIQKTLNRKTLDVRQIRVPISASDHTVLLQAIKEDKEPKGEWINYEYFERSEAIDNVIKQMNAHIVKIVNRLYSQ